MSSLRQTNMSSHTTHTTNHHLSNHDDNNLDSLLEDLQTSVSRPGSAAGHHLVQAGSGGGPLTTGYREVSRSVTTHGVNGPSNSTEYHIEYLNPANSTTVVTERSVSPGFDILNNSADIPPGTKKIAQYKVQSYQYKTVGGQNYQDGSGDSMKENINELDTLLDDLNTAQRTGFAAGNNIIAKKSTGLNSSFIEPLETSTPKGGHVSRSVEKKVIQEHRYGSVGRASPAREIKHEKVVHESSPLHQRKETYRYETKTTRSGGNMREASPPSPPAIRSSPSPSRHQQQQVRSYNYSSATEHDAPRTPSAFRRANSPSHRSPSPAGGKSTVKSYNYSSSSSSKYASDVQGHPQPPYRSPSPTSRTSSTARAHTYDQNRAPSSPTPQNKHTTVHSYNYSSSSTSKDTRQEVPKTPPPHRSPSPVSFPQPPLPSPKNTEGKPYTFPIKPQSPQPVQKFSPSDPSHTLNYQVSPHQPTVITYKYSSHSTQSTNYPGEDHVPLLPRPFPTSPSPIPDEQRPPKKLDELMASFSDSETHQHSSLRHRDVSSRYTHQPPQQHQSPQPPTPPTLPAAEPKVTRVNHQNSIEKSKNISGPPVYYPPGVELFSKKEEMMQQSEGGGMMKSKAKASYEYEAKSKSKVKESSGKAVVPVCLPVCCAMPCVIM